MKHGNNISASHLLALFSILLFPYISSLKIVSGSNRPLSALTLVPLGAAFLLWSWFKRNQNFPWVTFYSLTFLLLYGVTLAAFSSIETSIALKQAFIFLVGMFCFLAIYYILISIRHDNLYRYVIISLFPVILIGCIETAGLVKILPNSLIQSVNIFFSGASVNRLQLVTSEAAWASKLCLTYIALLLFLNPKTQVDAKLKTLLLLLTSFFILTFSIYGFIILALSYFTLSLLTTQHPIRLIRNTTLTFIAISALATLTYNTASIFLDDQYYFSRINKILSTSHLSDIIYIDGSIFIRITNSIIGILMFLDHPAGTGLGGYSDHYQNYVVTLFPEALSFREVAYDIADNSADPKSLYIKLLSENGLVGLLFLLYIFYKISRLRGLYKAYPSRKARNLYFVILVVFFTGFQTGSYIYLPYWLGLTLLLLCPKMVPHFYRNGIGTLQPPTTETKT